MPAVTVPRGDIFLEYDTGVPLVITCVLDPDNDMVRQLWPSSGPDDGAAGNGTDAVWPPPSRRIVFFKDAERVAGRYVSEVNATAAQLRIPDPPAGRALFSCMLRLNDPQQQRPRDRNDGDGDGVDAATVMAAVYSTVQPTSLETSGPPPLASREPMAGVCINSVTVGCKCSGASPCAKVAALTTDLGFFFLPR